MKHIFKSFHAVFYSLIVSVLSLSLLITGCLANPGETKNAERVSSACRYQRAIQIGGEWFLRNQNDKFLYYTYDVVTQRYSKSQHPLREMASLWALTRLAKYLDDGRFTQLADKGMAYFEGYFKYDEKNDFCYVDMGKGNCKLGETAFIMLSLLAMEYPEKDLYLEKFANGVLYLQQSDGSLNTIYNSDDKTSEDYYPGEALLAMMSLYEYQGDLAYLGCVKRAFPYYVSHFRATRNPAFVPWQTRAYQKLYRATGDKKVAEFIFEMNDFILQQYAPQDECDKFDFYRGIVTAVYLEGVNKAYELARDTGDVKRQKAYADFIRAGSDYILTLQLLREPSLPGVAVGGFIVNKNSPSLRVDQNQHAVMALMDSCDLGLLGR